MRTTIPQQIGLAVTALVLGTGCMTGRSAMSDPSPEPAPPLRVTTPTRANLVAVDEIQSVEPGVTALEAVRRLRPEFLHRHVTPMPGDAEGGYAVVYLDGTRLGGPETLATISAASVIEIRYLRSSAAVEQVGRNHRGGAILVSTIR